MNLRIDSKIILYFILILIATSGFLFTFLLPYPIGFYMFIVVSAMVGFSISLNIYDTKHSGKQLVCPTGSNCNVVITSRYAKFLNVSLEFWGMGYFLFIVFAYLALVISPILFTPNMMFALVLLSICAGFFSLYLLFVQAFLLRAWCIWCILTAMVSITICIVSLVSSAEAISFLISIESILDVIKSFGFALGVGGATASAVLLSRFLTDSTIDEKELDVIKGISEVVWVGFGLVIASQFAFLISNPYAVAFSNSFIIQIISLFVFAFAGALLMIIYAPFLVFIPFKKIEKGGKGESFARLRRPTITIGIIAIAMWYIAFAMDFVENISLHPLLLAFLLLIVCTAGFTIWWDKKFNTEV